MNIRYDTGKWEGGVQFALGLDGARSRHGTPCTVPSYRRASRRRAQKACVSLSPPEVRELPSGRDAARLELASPFGDTPCQGRSAPRGLSWSCESVREFLCVLVVKFVCVICASENHTDTLSHLHKCPVLASGSVSCDFR